ncbi:MAG: putative NAD-dependent epimerase/dehydratase, partial [Modestobacter sp.]|nr:putative NAD-dependent epimerase/dehydratase [Modestobacter sp.]
MSAVGGVAGRRAGPGAEGRGLAEPDFAAQAINGFGDPANSYVHCMTEFRCSVYAGTSRHSMALLKLFPPPEPPPMEPWPIPVPDSVEDLDMHGQIWRLRPDSDEWSRAFTSPDIVGRKGTEVPRDLGYRGMTVFQGKSDPEPARYVGAISTVLRGEAARLLRSEDGEHFEAVGEPGLGNPNVSTLRAMAGLDGHLYVLPAGEGITLNSSRASVIMRSPDPAHGPWAPACEPGFGETGNTGVFELAVFAGHLYAGTFNAEDGYQVWKTPATGGAPCRWTKVLHGGALRGPENEIAMSMAVFYGALFIGSAIQNGGYDRVNRVGPAASELVRVHPDDTWDLIVGEPRRTSDGVKEPLAGLGPGFDDPLAGYFWRMAVHDGWLYLSTFDWTVFLPFAGRPSAFASHLIERSGADELARREAGFELWRTADGVTWFPVTRTGFGNPYNYGARSLLPTSRGLLVGTANPFAPEAPARFVTGWAHVPNPRGGAEMWVGRRDVARPGTLAARNRAPARVAGRRSSPARRGRGLLLTGATGFVGVHLLPELQSRFGSVWVLAQPETVAELSGAVDVVPGDLTDPGTLRDAVAGVTTVVHLGAALPGARDDV